MICSYQRSASGSLPLSLLGHGQFHHRVGRIGVLLAGFDELFQIGDPLGLDLLEFTVGIAQRLAVFGREGPILHVEGELLFLLVGGQFLVQGFQSLDAARISARLHGGAERVGQLAIPGGTLFGVGLAGDFFQQLGAAVVRFRLVIGRDFTQLVQFFQQRLDLLVGPGKLRVGTFALRDAEEDRLGFRGIGQVFGQVRHVDHAPGSADADQGAHANGLGLAAVLDHGHHIFVDHDVRGQTVGPGGHDARRVAAERYPARLGGDDFLLGNGLGEGGRGPVDLLFQQLSPIAGQAQRLELLGAQQQPLEAAAVAIAHRGHQLGGDFLGRNHLPVVDPRVFVDVGAPAGASRVEPAILVDLAVGVRVDVAINLEAVLEVAPLVDGLVAVGVDEIAKDLPARVAHDPAILAGRLLGRDRATGRFGGRGTVVLHVALHGLKCQGFGNRRFSSPQAGGNRKRQDQGGREARLREWVGHRQHSLRTSFAVKPRAW